MSIGSSSLLCVVVLLLVIFTFVLQLIALTTTWWATFTARTDLGKPQEDGHYGLWTICSIKGPHWTEDCDPLDTFFEIPSYAQVSGIFGIIHLLFLLSFLPIGSLRAIQVIRSVPELGARPKTLCIAKLSIAFISVIFATLVAIFASVGDKKPLEYVIKKQWSFWIQISVIISNVITTLLCVTENVRFWRQHLQQNVDPVGHRAETYGNPMFEPGSPDLSDRHSINGTISYTNSSGQPYHPNGVFPDHQPRTSSNVSQHDRSRFVEEDSYRSIFFDLRKVRKSSKSQQRPEVLTYENESYQEHSPRRPRKKDNLN